MNILAIDTVTQACSVALLCAEERVQRMKIQGNQHSALLLNMVDEVLAESKLSLSDINLIAVNNGPGSFTGIRIGVGVAQGLAYGDNIPILGINSLAVLAAQTTARGPVLSMIDARMKQIYWAVYSGNPLHLEPSEWQRIQLFLTNPELIKVGNESDGMDVVSCGCDSYKNQLPIEVTAQTIIWDAYPAAEQLAELAARVDTKFYKTAATIAPVYLRDNVANVSTKALL